MADATINRQGPGQRWWLAASGAAEGPFSEAYLLAGLKSKTLAETALACPVGGQEWKQLREWQQFASAAASPAMPPPVSKPAGVPSDSPLTNPQLPSMANWICIYAIVISPVMWLVYTFSCCVTGTTFHEESGLFPIELFLHVFDTAASLALVVIFLIGGIKLRSLKRSGARLVRIGAWLSLGYGAFGCVGGVGLLAMAAESDFAESTPAGDVIAFLLLIPALIELAFLILTLVWLNFNEDVLPLADA